MTPRERLLAFGVAIAVGVLVVDQLIWSPAQRALEESEQALDRAQEAYDQTQLLVDYGDRLNRQWRGYQHAGLRDDIATARVRVQRALGQWADETDLFVSSLSAGGVLEHESFNEVRLSLSANGKTQAVLAFCEKLHEADFPLAVLTCDLSRKAVDSDELTLRLTVSTAVLTNSATNQDGGA